MKLRINDPGERQWGTVHEDYSEGLRGEKHGGGEEEIY
jgi:hypothetical protein